ncbi:hypothetical protein [Kitasatospora sp. NPDC058046]|uniref:hypothetical protein n=1 Tax=Kitasatospora sp. NPDC058046 TaxID=3346312 RepID=UPI0036DC26AF
MSTLTDLVDDEETVADAMRAALAEYGIAAEERWSDEGGWLVVDGPADAYAVLTVDTSEIEAEGLPRSCVGLPAGELAGGEWVMTICDRPGWGERFVLAVPVWDEYGCAERVADWLTAPKAA